MVERRASAGDRAVHLVGTRLDHLADRLLGGRIQDRERVAATGDPLTVDEGSMRDGAGDGKGLITRSRHVR
jgi:hypothetical protein